MCRHLDDAEHKLDRRTLLFRAAGVVAAAGVGKSLVFPDDGRAHDVPRPGARSDAATKAPSGGGGPILETVTGPVKGGGIRWALAHEHMFVDFYGPTSDDYMNVDWANVTGACVDSAMELRAQGVDLFIDWTNMGVGRNALLLRDVAKQTGLKIVCTTGIYKSYVPPFFAKLSVSDIAAHFYRELTGGIDGTSIRAGWVKCATTEDGPTASDTRIHRAAALAAKRAGCTISLHSPHPEATNAVVKTFESEGFDLRRFLWGHSQVSSSTDHIAMAKRGAMVQFDAISALSDPFFHGPTDDGSMLDRIEAMIDAGFADRVVFSTDASVFVNPAKYQYDRDNTYLYRDFIPKLRARIGEDNTRLVLRDNVIRAFRRGDRVK
jgi:predicted metal-dependent phosphotriesterase family hydrolase